MRVGTKSVLFGVHAFWWHPITVALAFRRVHRRLPSWWEAVGIACHDLAYVKKPNMDGLDGILHPMGGASLAAKIVGVFSAERAFDTYLLCLYHSSTFAKLHHAKPSDLYLPDKCAILMEPKWWYLFRARLSGEIHEYVKNSSQTNEDDWYRAYRASVVKKLKAHDEYP